MRLATAPSFAAVSFTVIVLIEMLKSSSVSDNLAAYSPWLLYMLQKLITSLQMKDGPGAEGIFEGTVDQEWETLNSETPVQVGATFTADAKDLRPSALTINGVACTLDEM